MGGMNFRDAYEYDPETYGGEGDGLLGMLRRTMQEQNPQQQGVDFGSTPNAAPEYNLNSYGSPQGGLLGRLLALQAEQSRYQPAAGNSGQASPVPQDTNFRQLSRVPVANPPQSAIDPATLPDGQSNPAYSPSGSNLAARPERSLSDRLEAYWNHPDPHGLIAILKAAQNAEALAVQSSIDATSAPSTEEEAFRQNLGRELGPIAAFEAASLQGPLAPRTTSGLGRLFLDFLRNRAASTVVAGINPLSPKSDAPQEQPTGGPPGIVSGEPMPQWPFPPPIWGPRR